MPETYVNIDFDLTAEDMAASVYDALQGRWPDWTPNDANLETWLIDAFTRLMAETATLSQRVALSIFQRFGAVIIGIPPILPAPAQVSSTWTLPDNAGYAIEAGTEVIIARTGDERYAFSVVSDVVVAPGDVATAAGEVLLQAQQAGADQNDIDSTTVPELLTANSLLYGSVIALTEDTHSGDDGETETEYTNRLVGELRLMAPRPILPRDFEAFARRHPDVYRVVAVDGWDPDTDTLDNERFVGLVAIEADGDDLNAGAKTEITDDLEARREVNFRCPFGSPTYNTIWVTTIVRAYVGFATADVDAAVTAAIESFLASANWGVTPHGDTDTNWLNATVLRYKDLVTVVENVPGVNYVESLYVDDATAPDAADVVDIALTGRVPLTRPATTGTGVGVTVNAGP